ncbi:MAG: hypothetical protein ABF274_03070 [Nonlabens sp.]|uniref:hypothetical protein n=1 Tax=Nonlabens sp. TaxID=1888209 RepID=UPI003219C785
MKNSNINTTILSALFVLFSVITYGQENNDTQKTLTNSLEEITVLVQKADLKDQPIFNENKKQLRKAARQSKGDIDKFKSQVIHSVPSFSDINNTKWEKLYNESKLLTFIGKVEELPSVL